MTDIIPLIMVSIDVANPFKGENDRRTIKTDKQKKAFIDRAKNDLQNTPGCDIYILEITNPPLLYQVIL